MASVNEPISEQERAQLRALLVDGMNSEAGSEMDQAYFDRLRAWIRAGGD